MVNRYIMKIKKLFLYNSKITKLINSLLLAAVTILRIEKNFNLISKKNLGFYLGQEKAVKVQSWYFAFDANWTVLAKS